MKRTLFLLGFVIYCFAKFAFPSPEGSTMAYVLHGFQLFGGALMWLAFFLLMWRVASTFSR